MSRPGNALIPAGPGWRRLRGRLEAVVDLVCADLSERGVRKPPWPRRAAFLARGFLSSRAETYGIRRGLPGGDYLSDLARLERVALSTTPSARSWPTSSSSGASCAASATP